MPLFLAIAIFLIGFFAYRFYAKRQHRQGLLSAALTSADRDIVLEHVPLVKRMPAPLRDQLEGKIQLFLDQVTFVGCDDLDITPEIRLSIAAQACLLVVNTDAWYDTLRTVLIYPGAFKSVQSNRSEYVVTEEETIRLGESWHRGPVILSWAHSQHGATNDRDGQNVVLHEFAHQIDTLSGHTDGAPLMAKGQSFAEWSRVFLTAYDDHVARVERGQKTVLDDYGATAHEEFFAVAVEVFFERPKALKQDAPEVYAQIATLLALDPASWDPDQSTG